MRPNFLWLCAVIMAATPHIAIADGPCTKEGLGTALQKIEQNLAKPSVQREIEKARADFAADQDFDDIDAALYLEAYALYLDIGRNLEGGAVDDACAKYEERHTMFDLLEAAE